MSKNNKITTASTAEYFAKNLQMVGFSSPAKAVLTTIKEGVDNSLDACEENGVLPEITVIIEKMGPGLTTKGSDLIKITVQDNGPGIEEEFVPQVYGTFLASSKFGRGKCSRGVQGLGASSAVAHGQTTTTQGVKVITKLAKAKKAYSCTIEIDFKNNKGMVKHPKEVDATFPHGTRIEFLLDGKVQINGDAGVLAYLNGTALVNPALTLHYKLPGEEMVTIERVSNDPQYMPQAVEPHPHTMNFNEFNIHTGIFPGLKVRQFLKDGFSRMAEGNIQNLLKKGLDKKVLDTQIDKLDNKNKMALYQALQDIPLLPPSTKSVRQIGEENLSKSIRRLGNVDFFSVVTRPATICDHKPLQVEVAVARLKDKAGSGDNPVQVLRLQIWFRFSLIKKHAYRFKPSNRLTGKLTALLNLKTLYQRVLTSLPSLSCHRLLSLKMRQKRPSMTQKNFITRFV